MAIQDIYCIELGEGTFLANTNIAQYQRVKLNSLGSLDVAGITDKSIGVAKQPISNTNYGVVRFVGAQGQNYGLANTNINVGDAVYSAANGFISGNSTGANQVGISTYQTTSNTAVPVTYIPVIQI
jgi:Uncharacterized conserved protein (DUF2190)